MSAKAVAVDIAKQYQNGRDDDSVVVFSTGVRGRFRGIPAGTIEAAQALIKDPPVPLQTIEGRDHPVENPLDPDYVRGLAAANRERGNAAIDVMAIFGLELEDGLPADDGWLKKLKLLEKLKRLDLSAYELSDEIEREFVYKRFVAMGSDEIVAIGRKSGIRGEDVQLAREAFQGNS
jgi:hypothetical protein